MKISFDGDKGSEGRYVERIARRLVREPLVLLVRKFGHFGTVEPMEEDLLIGWTCFNENILAVSCVHVTPYVVQLGRDVETLQSCCRNPARKERRKKTTDQVKAV